jgi:hypothetical protein
MFCDRFGRAARQLAERRGIQIGAIFERRKFTS